MITWSVPYSGNSLIISYQAQVKKAKESWSDTSENHQIESSNGNVNVLTLRKLKPTTSYEVRIRCENALGWSGYSDVLQFVTKEEAPNRPPVGVHVYPLNSRQLQVTFKPPEPEESTVSVIKGYYVGYRLIVNSENGQQQQSANQSPSQIGSQAVAAKLPEQVYIFKTVTLNELSSENSEKPFEVKLTDLRRASKYGIIIQGKTGFFFNLKANLLTNSFSRGLAFNSKGSGPASEEIYAMTLFNDPPDSPLLSVGQVSHSSIQLRWTFANAEFNEQLRKAIDLEQQSLEGAEEGAEQISQPAQQFSQQPNQTINLLPAATRSGSSGGAETQTAGPIKPNRESLVTGYYLHYKR